MGSEPKSSMRHYAILIGICFTPLERRSEWQPLKGCVQDVQSMRKQLMKSFPHSDTQVLTASLQHPDDARPSGSVVRDRLDPLVKYLPYNLAVDVAHPPEPDPAPNEENEDAGPVYRAASSRLNWLIDPEGYVVLAACGPTEKAMELDFGNGQFYGALSYFLVRAFIRRGGVGGKHQYIYSHIVSRFREKCPNQRPMLYGNNTLSFFTDSTFPWHAAPIPVVKTATGLQLEAGLAHGISSEDFFAIDPDDPTSDLTIASTSSPLTFKATEVRGLTSDLELLDSNAGAFTAASGLTATAITRLSLRRFTIGLNLQIPRSEVWSKAVHDRVSLHITYVDGTEDATTFTFIVTVLTNDYYQIREYGDLIPDKLLPKSMYPLEENAEFVLDVMEHVAQYWDIYNLREPNYSENPLREQFGVSLVASDDRNYHSQCCHPTTHPMALVKDGDSLELVVLNWGLSALYVNVFAMGAIWDVEDLLYANHEVIPQRLSYNALEFFNNTSHNSGEWRLKIRMSLPKELGDSIERCDDYIKVCITSQPTSFTSLEQPNLGEFLTLRRKNRHRHRRGEQDTSASLEAWAMLTFPVHTYEAGAWEDMMRDPWERT